MLDIDGTIVPNREGAGLSPKVITAIKKAQKKLAVCVATGRTLKKASEILDALEITSPAILLGGAQIIAGPTRKFIYKRPLEENAVPEILSILKPYKARIVLDEDAYSTFYTPTKEFKHTPYSFLVLDVTEEIADEMSHKLLHIPTVVSHKIVSWQKGLFCLNISHTYATKQHAVFEVAEYMGINTHEMIGVGEGPNDFPLLMACGLKIAMGNAVEGLKAIADYIAPSVEEDGVADVIEKFVL